MNLNEMTQARAVLIGMLTEQGIEFKRISFTAPFLVTFVRDTLDELDGADKLEFMGYTVKERFTFKNQRGTFTENVRITA